MPRDHHRPSRHWRLSRLLLLPLAASTLLAACGGDSDPVEPNPTPDPPAISSFEATPPEILPGASSTLAWATSDATSCTVDQGVGPVPCNGSRTVAPTAATTYTLSATGDGGTVTADIEVSVVPLTLVRLDPAEGEPGDTVEVTLTGTGFADPHTSVTVGGVGVAVDDFAVVSADTLTASLVIDLGATPGDRAVSVESGGLGTASLTFTVAPLPVPTVTGATPATGVAGETVIVALTGTGFIPGATTLAISGVGAVAGELQFGPTGAPGDESIGGPPAGAPTATSLSFELAIAADAPPGAREITVETPGGVSEPIEFTIQAPLAGALLITAGWNHTCAIDSDHAAWCWGFDTSGRLGNGAVGSSASAVEVLGGLRFSHLSAGNDFTCGITTEGEAYCWGAGTAGELGNGAFADSSVPVAVSGGHTFASLEASLAHTCGVTTDGAAYCWGLGSAGRLGNGSSVNRAEPVAVSGGHTFSKVVTKGGGPQSCGIRTDGVAMCWGSNTTGQIGDGTTTDRMTPTVVSGGHTWIDITTGNGAACGLRPDGSAMCWGSDGAGRLGNGAAGASSVPTPVDGGLVFTEIDGGFSGHFCAVTDDGAGYCWGSNFRGRLGDGTTDNREVPTPVSGALEFESIDAGGNHTCGRRSDGRAYCWGNGNWGELGNDMTVNSPTPVEVITGPFGPPPP